MSYVNKINNALKNLENRMLEIKNDLERIENEFNDLKLNPYGITSVDFSTRQELSSDLLKVEGTIMGLQLALDLMENEHNE